VYRRVLIPIDGSPCSDAALERGLELAQLLRASVRIIHVFDARALLRRAEGIHAEEILEECRRAGRTLIDAASERAQEVEVQSTVALIEDGPIAAAILSEADRWSADLIVMGTEGQRKIHRLIVESVAERVARAAPVPILLVRHIVEHRARHDQQRLKSTHRQR
jgi:nucleotide-binding universal stress UspA family protein